MKTTIIVPILTVLMLSACSSSYLAKSGNDDLYYTPQKGSNTAQVHQEPGQVATSSTSNAGRQNKQQMTDYEKYRNSLSNNEMADTTVNQPVTSTNDSTVQNPADSKEPIVNSDEYYGQGGDSYADDNYYYASRLNRFNGGFYDPYFYDPYAFNAWYDPFYSPGWGFSLGFGLGFGYGWGSLYYNPYYSPFYGGYWGYGYNPYWYGRHSHGYYEGYGHYNGYGNNSLNRRYGRIPNQSGLTNNYSGRNVANRSALSGSNMNSSRVNAGRVNNSRGSYASPATGRRYATGSSAQSNGQVYTRRTPANNSGNYQYTQRANVNGQNTGNRVSTRSYSNPTRTYTPSYSKPRTYSRAYYNDGNTSRTYSSSSSQTSSRPSATRSSSYSRPSGSSNYSRPSSSSSSGRSYSAPASSSSSRSYSSGSSSSSGGRSNSGGGSSGGGGGGGRRR